MPAGHGSSIEPEVASCGHNVGKGRVRRFVRTRSGDKQLESAVCSATSGRGCLCGQRLQQWQSHSYVVFVIACMAARHKQNHGHGTLGGRTVVTPCDVTRASSGHVPIA